MLHVKSKTEPGFLRKKIIPRKQKQTKKKGKRKVILKLNNEKTMNKPSINYYMSGFVTQQKPLLNLELRK